MRDRDSLVDGMLLKMSRIAKFAHNKEGQVYAGRPYDYHLQQVDMEVRELVQGRYLMLYRIVAHGHDLFEDTGIDAEYLRDQGFSEIVIDAITAITKGKNERRTDYLQRVMDNPIAHLVKIADTLSNLNHSVRSMNKRRINKYTHQLDVLYTREVLSWKV